MKKKSVATLKSSSICICEILKKPNYYIIIIWQKIGVMYIYTVWSSRHDSRHVYFVFLLCAERRWTTDDEPVELRRLPVTDWPTCTTITDGTHHQDPMFELFERAEQYTFWKLLFSPPWQDDPGINPDGIMKQRREGRGRWFSRALNVVCGDSAAISYNQQKK